MCVSQRYQKEKSGVFESSPEGNVVLSGADSLGSHQFCTVTPGGT